MEVMGAARCRRSLLAGSRCCCSSAWLNSPSSHLLPQVIELTRELCQGQAEAPPAAPLQQEAAGAAAPPPPPGAPSSSQVLPPQVAEQIRVAQQRAALGGQGPAEWAVGAKCRALYSGDGNW